MRTKRRGGVGSSYAPDLLGPEQPVRSDDQDDEHDDVRHHAGEAETEERPAVTDEIGAGVRLGESDDEPADDGAGDRVETADDDRGQRPELSLIHISEP